MWSGFASLDGDSERIRTSDPLLRRQLLYPAELRSHIFTIRFDSGIVIRTDKGFSRPRSIVLIHKWYFCKVKLSTTKYRGLFSQQNKGLPKSEQIKNSD